ncbi:SAM-dependent methyltransferase [Wenjunlia tyrosinilytica]|uniref:S-adenosyl-L-methionine-dependent methyltransferase n=1 Tax=Wenjunlia tyrosinilytica TaxID=1544741 RepID=A0A918DYU8_9ACTN|nr:SAM-dependent methyltransferase [Wenjunlia tyrosinilytica]GGO93370.1 S-adenosyl-L-methionine-dependent methyltransferase [Wenjunlia tyrosinilytica]
MEAFDAVAKTSLLTSALRAQENLREDRLYEDPYAAHLATALGWDLFGQVADATRPSSTQPGSQVTSTFDYNAIRTRFFDEYLVKATVDQGGGPAQVVLAAAGMDTRAYRLAWPGPVNLYELDRPAVLAAKESALEVVSVSPGVTRRTLGVDLLDDDWSARLRERGYRPDEPSVWLLEGLLYYITEQQARRVLDQVRKASAPGSLVAADIVSATAFTSPAMQPLLDAFDRWGCPWLFGHDEPEAFFAEHGIKAQAVQPGEEHADYGRWRDAVHPRDVPDVERVFLVHGRRT